MRRVLGARRKHLCGGGGGRGASEVLAILWLGGGWIAGGDIGDAPALSSQQLITYSIISSASNASFRFIMQSAVRPQ